MKCIQLTITLDETNLILEALGELPFVRVHQLIGKIQEQATEQLRDERGAAARGNHQADGPKLVPEGAP